MDKCTVRNDLPNSSLESLCVEIKPARSAPFLILAWYRPPGASGEIFDQLEKTLEFLGKEGKEIILLGDTNCDILSNYPTVPSERSPNLSPHSNRLLHIYNLFGLQQLIETATNETASSSTLIDHVATNNKSSLVISGVHPLGLSDHYLVYCIRKFRGSSKKQHKNISTRSLQNFNKAEFLNDFLSVDWKGIVSNTDDINTIVEQWSRLFSLILEKHAPIRNKRVSEKFSPWLTKDFHTMSATRDRIRKLAVKSKSQIFMQAYIMMQIRNRVNKMNLDSEREFFKKKISSYAGDVKGSWKVINQVLNKKSKTTHVSSLNVDGKTILDDATIAESMNDFFCDIGKVLSDKMPATSNPLLTHEYSVNKVNSKFQFTPVDTRQVGKVFGKFKSSMGSGPDGIANFFLKAVLPIFAESLCDIFNLSLATGVFPACWKVARVTPILKNGEQTDRSNYRPISVLPFLSRVFEMLVYNQLYEYLDENKHLFLHQSGFRR